MTTIISEEDIKCLLFKQLTFFEITEEEKSIIEDNWVHSLNKIEYCFAQSSNKYFKRNGEVFFNPFHASQWCMSLYIISRQIYECHGATISLPDKIYYLNRMLNGCDLFYEVALPSVFYLDHPLGAVIGKGSFQDGFSFRQGCNVGNNKGIFPKLGKNVKMLANSKILGNCAIGDNVILSAGSIVKDRDIPSNTIVFGSGQNLVLKENKGQYNFG